VRRAILIQTMTYFLTEGMFGYDFGINDPEDLEFVVDEVLDFLDRPEQSYVPPPTSPPLEAMSQLFYFGGSYASASVPLRSPNPDWAFNVLLDGAFMDTSAAPARRTVIGTATFTALHRWDDNTVIAGGLKLGASGTTFVGPADTVNTAMFGADIAVLHMFSPTLFAGLYGGYELNIHQSSIAGVNSTFPSHLLKGGANLEGVVELDPFTLRPAVSALVQFRHQPAYTDGAGVPMAAVNMLDIDALAGVTAERAFLLSENDVVITPFVGLNLWASYSTTTGPAIGYDSLRLQVLGGLRLAWGNGFNASIQGDVSRGATSTMVGVSATLSGPIH
jgi:hypothetical protein